ncbi:hypothetical protein [Xanthomonas arboricola]|uniref:hypothetical protein n=1 Tax=Xanthomonas arboricola TaxID=56448 RepID=UPI00141AF263|nr:hypothetical protein [Xanthomonas arboricola]NIJ86979.1 hypothetical protein [Xanthomonas arboricola]NJB80305.1 hypothetical protein [Xanthomonas arboricola]
MTTARRSVGVARLGIALIVLTLYGISVAVLVNAAIPQENKDPLMLLLGNLGPAIGAVMAHYFNDATRRPSGG